MMEPNVWTSYCSSGSCVEVQWRTACDSGTCVEVSRRGDRVLVRDNKLGDDSPVLTYTPPVWRWLTDRIRNDQRVSTIAVLGEQVHWARTVLGPAPSLVFTRQEWDEFVEGVRAGKFEVQP